MNSLKVSWTAPKRKNGQLLGYIVTYETAEQNERMCDKFYGFIYK